MANILDILTSPGGRRTAARTFRSALARLRPTEEAAVRESILANLPEIGARSAAGGQTFDPRAGRFIETMYSDLPASAQDAGYVMAPRPELEGARAYLPDMPLSPDDIEPMQNALVQQRVLDLLSNPQMMEDLQRGGMLGSWASGPAVVVDPSRQYLTKSGSLRAGRRSGQEAGFAPRTGEYSAVDAAADRSLRRRRALELSAVLAALAGGAAAVEGGD